MQIDLFETMDQLEALKEVWCDVYRRDPESQFYLSWWWLTHLLSKAEDDWLVLTATPEGGDRPVAFLPLRLKLKRHEKNGLFLNGFSMAGNYTADYTGFLCLPEFEDRAIPAFAEQLKTMTWAFLRLDYLRASDRRKALFLDAFPRKTFRIESNARISEVDNVDHLICPYVDLPDTFEAYLTEKLSTNTRQKLRRLLRKVDAGEEYRITHADADSIDRDIETLLTFWQAQWASRKGERLPHIVSNSRTVLRGGFDLGHLFLPVLWQGDRPLAALGSFLDHEKKTVLFMISGRDQSFDAIQSGLVLHAYSIRLAIENGFRTYDFLRGNEQYKYSFGCRETTIDCITVSTRSGVNLGDKLAARTVPLVFSRVTQFHQEGRRKQAETGYRQILATAPEHTGALYGLGQLLAAKKDYAGAVQQFEAFIGEKPGSAKAWQRLAQAYQGMSEVDDACKAFRKAIEIDPGHFSARYGLAKCLADMGRQDEAIDMLNAILRLLPRTDEDREIAGEATKLLSLMKPGLVVSHPLKQPTSRPGQSPLDILRDRANTSVSLKLPGK